MSETRAPILKLFENADELADAVASAWVDLTARSAGKFCVALSGGRISTKLFNRVVAITSGRREVFQSTHFFWADERCVPPDHEESNYRMAHELLIGRLGIPGERVHRVQGELAPDEGARRAEEEMRRVVSVAEGGLPALDLVLLGMGEDGHVASLFPGEPEAGEAAARVYRSVRNSPKPPPDRVTLTYEAILAAREVWVIVSGAGKQAALRESLLPVGRTPCGRILRGHPRAAVFTDIDPA